MTLLYAGSSFLMLLLAAASLYWSLVDNLKREDNAFLADEIQEYRRLLRAGPSDEQLLVYEIPTESAARHFITNYARLLGCLILVEKMLGEHSIFNRQFINYYYDRKKRYGYSESGDYRHGGPVQTGLWVSLTVLTLGYAVARFLKKEGLLRDALEPVS